MEKSPHASYRFNRIGFYLNGKKVNYDLAPGLSSLDFINKEMHMYGTKCSCNEGDCGACTVLLDGKAVRSCLILAIEADRHDIVTVEGISQDKLSALQEAFIQYNSFQCGFCAPGIILAITELLDKNPHPSLMEVKEAMAGHLCRCTGYTPIFDAIMALTGEDK